MPNETEKSNIYIEWLKELIDNDYINYYKYFDFEGIELIGNGNFGKVFRANWTKNSDTIFALKSFDTKLTPKEIINEV
jgi:hypothetical protein